MNDGGLFCYELLQEELDESLAIKISNVANLILFAAKVYASVKSDSLVIIASTLDSLLDILSGLILWFTAFSMQTPNPYVYAIGKQRMQPLGILVFASAMATIGLQIMLDSIRSLAASSSHDVHLRLSRDEEKWVINTMSSVTLVKLGLTIYCRSFTHNPIIKAYAKDHFFDVVTNTIGLVADVLANYLYDWIDPFGAIIVSKDQQHCCCSYHPFIDLYVIFLTVACCIHHTDLVYDCD